jgi:hypothetical protein
VLKAAGPASTIVSPRPPVGETVFLAGAPAHAPLLPFPERWADEPGGKLKAPTTRDYGTVGYVISGSAARSGGTGTKLTGRGLMVGAGKGNAPLHDHSAVYGIRSNCTSSRGSWSRCSGMSYCECCCFDTLPSFAEQGRHCFEASSEIAVQGLTVHSFQTGRRRAAARGPWLHERVWWLN